jgi:hypothetical protein
LDAREQFLERGSLAASGTLREFLDLLAVFHLVPSWCWVGGAGGSAGVDTGGGRCNAVGVIEDRMIGRYRLQRWLGSGAFATVWLAHDETLDSLVALKVLAENWAYRADVSRRFVEEARLLRRADSEAVVRVFDIEHLADGRPYFVMSYANGGTLAERLARGPLSVEDAVATGLRVAEAVAVLNEAGIIHRDLKPSNVLFHDPGGGERLLLADLGLAKETAYASGFTLAAGTPGYRAPEQARPGGGIDERADVYAVAALTYRMLTGLTPDAASAEAGAALLAPSALRPEVPAALEDVVLTGLATEPATRYVSAGALAGALASARAAPSGEPAPAGGRRRLGWASWVAGAVIVLLLAAVVGLVIVRPGPIGTVLAGGGHSGPVRVSDAEHRVSIAVPPAWRRRAQVHDAGWNPATIGLAPAHAPGLAASPDLRHWRDPSDDDPGIFVGLTRKLHRGRDSAATVTGHDRCVRAAHPTPASAGQLRGHALRWSDCAGGTSSFTKAVLYPPGGGYGVYVQIKQVGGHDESRAILASLRVTAP